MSCTVSGKFTLMDINLMIGNECQTVKLNSPSIFLAIWYMPDSLHTGTFNKVLLCSSADSAETNSNFRYLNSWSQKRTNID